MTLACARREIDSTRFRKSAARTELIQMLGDNDYAKEILVSRPYILNLVHVYGRVFHCVWVILVIQFILNI